MVSDPKLQKKQKKTATQRLREEADYMKKGAKRLPSLIGQKGREYIQRQIEEAREQRKRDAELRRKSEEARRKAFEKETLRQARIRGAQQAKAKASGRQSLDVSDLLGMEGFQSKQEDLLGLGDLRRGREEGSKSRRRRGQRR